MTIVWEKNITITLKLRGESEENLQEALDRIAHRLDRHVPKQRIAILSGPAVHVIKRSIDLT